MNSLILNLKEKLSKFIEEPLLDKSELIHFTLNSNIYTSAAQYKVEEALLAESAVIIGNSEDCKFEKICPHRGATLVQTDFGYLCPFHGWEFDLDGKLSQTTGNKVLYRPGTILSLIHI